MGLGTLRRRLLAGASWAGQVGWLAGLGWTGGWLVPSGARLGPASFYGLSYRVEAGVEQPGWAICLLARAKPPKSVNLNEGSDLFRNWIYEAMFRCNGENKGLLPLAASAKALADVQLDAF